MGEIGNFLVSIAIFAGFLLIFIFAIKGARKKLRSQLEPIANALGGELVSGWLVNNYVRIPGYDYEAQVVITPRGKNTPPKLTIRFLDQLDFQITITAENVLTGVLKKIHLAREVEIGDPIFDQKYLISTRDRDKVQAFLLSGSRREAVDFFFSNGFSRMGTFQNSVGAEKNNYQNQDLDPGRIREDLDRLRKFISG